MSRITLSCGAWASHEVRGILSALVDPLKKRIAAAVAVGVPLVLGAAAWFWWIPNVVESRAEAAIASRLGMRGQVGDVDMRLRGAVLEDVAISGEAGGVQIRIEEVGVRIGLLAALFEGAAALEEVQARGAQVEVDLTDPGLEESLAALRAARARGAARAADDAPGEHAADEDGGGFTLGAVGVNVTIDDREGRLLTLRGGRARVEGHEIEGDLAAITVGAEPYDTLSADVVALSASRGEEGLRISALTIGSGNVSWAFREAPDDENTEENAPRPTLRRLGAALATLRGPSEETPEEPSDGPGWLARLEDGAHIEVSDIDVRTRTAGGGEELVMADLEASLDKLDAHRVRARGSGVPGERGTLAWDLTVAPVDLRAQGSLEFEDVPLALVAPLVPDIPFYQPERSLLSGALQVDGEGADRIGLRGRVAVEDAALFSSRIAPDPVGGLSVVIEGEGAFLPPSRRLEIERATIRMGEAEVIIQGALERTEERYLVDATATLPPTNCSDAVGAIPEDLLGELSTFSLSGLIGGRVRAHVDSEALDDLTLDIDVSDGCIFETVPPMADLARVAGPFLHRVHEPDGSWFEMTTGPGSGNWSSIYRISPYLVHAVLAHEDASFFSHSGFAPWAIRKALAKNLSEGRFVQGASTISMQLAKNLFLHREKYLARKVQEVLLTWWLEKALDKPQILELYLNIIEYGTSLYGITEASNRYFGVEPEDLTPAQSAFLASVLPNPKLYYGQYERNELSESMRNRMRRLLTHMHARGRIDQAALDYGLAELDTFRFYREGDPLPTPPQVTGSTGPLPFATTTTTGWADGWEQYADEAFEAAWESMTPEQL